MSDLRVTRLRGRTEGSSPSLPDGAVVAGVTTSGSLKITDSTQSTSVTTGAVVISGGVGIAKSLHVGGNVSVAGTLTYEDVTNVDSVGLITAKSGIKVGNPSSPGIGVTIDPNGNAVFAGILTATTFSGIEADKIFEGNTEVETIDTGSDGHVKMTTEGSERVRVGPAGQIGIGGANYGASGQVLTSAGSGSAPTWSPSSGPSVDIVADGAIAAGRACFVTSAGKAKQVAAELAGVNQLPDDTSTGEYTFPAAVDQYDLSWNAQYDKVLFSYYSSTTVKVDVLGFDEAYGSDTTSNLKTKSIYGGANTNANTSMAWDPDTNQTIIGYRDSNRMRISYASLDSGSEVTLGTAHAVTDDTVYPETLRVVYDTLNNAVICIWHAGNGNGIHARAGTISGDTMTWGDIVQLSSVTTAQGTMDACWDSTNNKVLVAFRNNDNSYLLAGVALSCSGTTLTWGSVVTLAGYAASFIRLCFDSTEGKAFLTFKNNGDNNGYAKTFYINSGTTVTSGTDVMFPGATSGGTTWADNDLKGHSTCYDSRAKRIIINGAWTNSGLDNPFGIMAVINTGADTISFKGTTVLYDGGFQCNDTWNRWASLSLGDASLNWGKTIAIGRRTSPSTRLWMFKTCTSTTNWTTGMNFLGFAPSAISDGATGTINVAGNTVGNQSGLTPGTRYYVQSSGDLGTSNFQNYHGGLAISATSILIRTGNS